MSDEQGRRMRQILWVLGAVAVVILLASGVGSGVTGFEMGFYAFVLAIGAVVVLVIRGLVRVGDKRPTPVQVVNMSQGGAGWYPDQHDSSQLRWFDGSQWTPYTRPNHG
ncbi:DUF2510 domain-containing protein [Rhodococcus sp. NPDC056960]|uniref:DUF2510 domain-containing protein n=1 Tax=Rhodococcus sp. NPDC056960 TaxID=3345982 RepID=UPI0036370C6A